jgi:hypothetical protein
MAWRLFSLGSMDGKSSRCPFPVEENNDVVLALYTYVMDHLQTTGRVWDLD